MAVKLKPGIRHTNEAAVTTLSTASTTAIVLFVANEFRVAVWVSNLSNKSIAARFITAATDTTDFKGITIAPGTSVKIIGDGDIYTGEISLIGDGSNLDFSAVEF